MKKPQAVSIAVILYIVSLLLGPVILALDYDYMTKLVPAAGLYGALVISFALSAFLIWKMSQGRNWARIVLLIFFVLGSYTAYTAIIQSLERSTLLGVMQAIQQLSILAALVLVFFPPGAEYFKKPEAPAAPAEA